MPFHKRITGFLLLSAFLLSSAVLSAEEPEEQEEEVGFRVLVLYPEEDLEAGMTWTLALYTEHSEPNQVTILAPPFTDMIFLDRMLKGPRMVGVDIHDHRDEKTEGEPPNERWTVTEFHFTLNSPGTLSFDSFTVITPLGQIKTEPFEVIIELPKETVERPHHRFSWQGVPAQLKIGESAVVVLSLAGRYRTLPHLPDSGHFIPMVPPGHIFEFIPLSPDEMNTGIALKIRLIPLTATPLTLDRRMFTYDNSTFEVPSMRIPVSRQTAEMPVREGANVPFNSDAEDRPAITPAQSIPPFPSLKNAVSVHDKLYTKHRAECEKIFNTAKDLWERGSSADSLAVLRRNERDHQAGIIIAIVRREAEQALGITGTNSEKKDNPFFTRRNKPRPAIVRETTVHQIPDLSGAEITRFREGQPVLVLSENDRSVLSGRGMSWLQVITNDSAGSTGWIPEEKIIYY